MCLLVTLLSLVVTVCANYPLFDVSTTMRILLVPVDAKVGSAIYRLKGSDSDFDYPLHFDVVGSEGGVVIRVENLPCRRNQTHCEANVILAQQLEKARVYDVKMTVRDTTGDATTINCTIKTTNATTPMSTIFPHMPTLIMVPEDTERGVQLDYVLATKHPNHARFPFLQLQGSSMFKIKQTLASQNTINGSITLHGSLDFETQIVYHLTVFAMEAYAEPKNDTRNLVSFDVAIVVLDVQDTPPVFIAVPPVTRLNSSLQTGDVVLQVHAEDGDKGVPRPIRYGLASEGRPLTPFFTINEKTGAVSLARSLRELAAITRGHQPILLTVVAEEVKVSLEEPPAMSSTAHVALLLGDLGNSAPYFETKNFVAHIDENSPQGTALVFAEPYVTQIKDDDMGKHGVFSISLTDNGTFEVFPTVGERRAQFIIQVRNNRALDYETMRSMEFYVVARELGPDSSLSSSALVTVYVNDVNDNPPEFVQPMYEATLREDVTANTRVTQVEAKDVDTGKFGAVHYTRILGPHNASLLLDTNTGIVTVATNNHAFDREVAPEFHYYVEARDLDGGPDSNVAKVPLVIKVQDVNDEKPIFDKTSYEFIVAPDLRNFTLKAFVKAVDKDMEAPNNIVRYEITNGNLDNMFILDKETGELLLREPFTSDGSRRRPRRDAQETVRELLVKAYDMGSPQQFMFASVMVYPPGTRSRTMWFIVNGSNPDISEITKWLTTITGAKVTIKNVQPYEGKKASKEEKSARQVATDKVMVEAEVNYENRPVLDLSQLQKNPDGGVVVKEAEKTESADSSTLFWVLIVLAIIIVIIIIIIILCCICPGCLLYMSPRKRARVASAEDNLQLVIKEEGPGKETKAVQAEWDSHSREMREAWSADRRQRYWRFNRRNNPTKELEDLRGGKVDLSGAAAAGTEDHHSFRSLPGQQLRQRDGPAVIYSRELQALQQRAVHGTPERERDVFLEDVEGGQLLDPRDTRPPHPGVARVHAEEDRDTDSIRRHEVERGSDVGRRGDARRAAAGQAAGEYRIVLERAAHGFEEDEDAERTTTAASRREQFYIRDGNAEILRLVTRGRSDDEQYTASGSQQRPPTFVPRQQQHVVRIDNGKEIIMQRFMEDQRTNGGAALQSGTLQQDLLVRRLLEEQARRVRTEEQQQSQPSPDAQLTSDNQETQSLPGHAIMATMATQTDVDNSTQTEPMHLMRPPRRLAKSDNDDSFTEEEIEPGLSLRDVPSSGSGGKSVRWVRRNRTKRKRHRGDHRVKRSTGSLKKDRDIKWHKIKTPIIEETESALEAAERQAAERQAMAPRDPVVAPTSSYTENKSSMLRRRKAKSMLVSTSSGEMEVTTVKPEKDERQKQRRPSPARDDDTPTDSLEERSPRKQQRRVVVEHPEDAGSRRTSASSIEYEEEERRDEKHHHHRRSEHISRTYTEKNPSSRRRKIEFDSDVKYYFTRDSSSVQSSPERWVRTSKNRSDRPRSRSLSGERRHRKNNEGSRYRSHLQSSSGRSKHQEFDEKLDRRSEIPIDDRRQRSRNEKRSNSPVDEQRQRSRNEVRSDSPVDERRQRSRKEVRSNSPVDERGQRSRNEVRSNSPVNERRQRSRKEVRSDSPVDERRQRSSPEKTDQHSDVNSPGDGEQDAPYTKSHSTKPSRGESRNSTYDKNFALTESSSTRKSRRNSVSGTNENKSGRLSSRRKSLSEPGRFKNSSSEERRTGTARSKSVSENGTPPEVPPSARRGSVSVPSSKTTSRYMEWYKTKKEEREKKKREEEEKKLDLQRRKMKSSSKTMTKGSSKPKAPSHSSEDSQKSIEIDDAGEVVSEEKVGNQQVLKVAGFEDDLDSGIAMSSMLLGGKKRRHHQLMEKKSVFTIAYDDMQTKQLRPDSTSPQY